MPVRTLKKSYRGQPSYYMSHKALNTSVFCESTLERDFSVLLEFFYWVVTYEEQPFKVPYLNADGVPGKWTPDSLATLRLEDGDEQWLYEVKYRKDLWENWAEYKPKFRGALWYCRDNDIQRFKIMTDVEIRRGSKLKNIKLFLKNRFSQVDQGLVDFTLNLLVDCVTMDTRLLLKSLWDQGVDVNDANVVLYHLIANHRIGLDIESTFTYDTDLWLLPGAMDPVAEDVMFQRREAA